jgi:hypothetical protein
LRVTAGDDDVCFRRGAQGAADNLAAFSVRPFGDTAGVEDKYVGRFIGLHDRETAFEELSADGRSLGEIELAAERVKGDFFHIKYMCDKLPKG